MKPHMKPIIAALLVGCFGLTGCDIVGDMTVDEVIQAARDAVENRDQEESSDVPDPEEDGPIEPADDEPLEPDEEAPIEPGEEEWPEDEEPFEPDEEEESEDESPLEPEDEEPNGCIDEFEACLAQFEDEDIDDEPGEDPICEDEEELFEGEEDAHHEDGDDPIEPGSEGLNEWPPEDEAPIDDADEIGHDPAEVCFEILEQCEGQEPEEALCEERYEEAALCGEDLDACLTAVEDDLENAEEPVLPAEDGEEGEAEVHDHFGACFEAFDRCEAEVLGEECYEDPEAPDVDDPAEALCEADLDVCLDGLSEDEPGDEAQAEVCFEMHQNCVLGGVEGGGEPPVEPVSPEVE